MNGQIFLYNFCIHHTGMLNFLICVRNIYSINTENAHTQIQVYLQQIKEIF